MPVFSKTKLSYTDLSSSPRSFGKATKNYRSSDNFVDDRQDSPERAKRYAEADKTHNAHIAGIGKKPPGYLAPGDMFHDSVSKALTDYEPARRTAVIDNVLKKVEQNKRDNPSPSPDSDISRMEEMMGKSRKVSPEEAIENTYNQRKR